MSGELMEAAADTDTVRVLLTIFERQVPVELEPWQITPSPYPYESEWPPGTDFRRMLAGARCHATTRQVRLLGVACCRRICRLMAPDRCRRLLEWAERLGTLEGHGPLQPDFL